MIFAQEKAHVNEATGKTVWSYHARVPELRPGAAYAYAVTAGNDANAADPFTSTFRTAPAGRAAFQFTCSGDLAVPHYQGAAHLAGAVESFQPLFHLLNGGLCDAATGLGPASWRALGDGSQLSAASRPWMPVSGSHDPAAKAAYLARYAMLVDGSPESGGRCYSFRVGSVLFASLDSGGVASGGVASTAQTRWLERTLARARADAAIDWIIVSAHHAACSAAGSHLGVREEWLPLLDRYSVDLLLAGHGAGYERSFPCRGCDQLAGRQPDTGVAVETRRPHPVTQVDSGVFDTSQGTVHLTLGPALAGPAAVGQDTHVPGDHVPGMARVHGLADGTAVEDATWSARRDPAGGHGVAVFTVDPGTGASDHASITISYYRTATVPTGEASPPADDLTELERFVLVRPRAAHRRQLISDSAPAATPPAARARKSAASPIGE